MELKLDVLSVRAPGQHKRTMASARDADSTIGSVRLTQLALKGLAAMKSLRRLHENSHARVIRHSAALSYRSDQKELRCDSVNC